MENVELLALIGLICLMACTPLPRTSSWLNIIGGIASDTPGSFASIAVSGASTPICGATLIAPSVLATAAHCLDDLEQPLLVYPRPPTALVLDPDQAITPTRIVRHPFYNGRTLKNDIALIFIKPAESLRFPGFLPIAWERSLDEPEAHPQFEPKVYGWGNVTNYGSLPSTYFRSVSLPLLPLLACQSAGSSYSSVGPEQICLGDLAQGGRDACTGDSGGPLLSDPALGPQRLLGMVSWGLGCGQKQTPGVYTRLAAYSSWIEETMLKDEATLTSDERISQACYWGGHDFEESNSGPLLWSINYYISARDLAPASKRQIHGTTQASSKDEASALDDEQLAIFRCEALAPQRVALFKEQAGSLAKDPRYKLELTDSEGKKGNEQRALLVSSRRYMISCDDMDWNLNWDDGAHLGELSGPDSIYEVKEQTNRDRLQGAELVQACVHDEAGFLLWKDKEGKAILDLRLAEQSFFKLEAPDGLRLNLQLQDQHLHIHNLSKSSVYSYVLACGFPFSLGAEGGVSYAAQKKGDELYEVRFIHPENAFATIPAQAMRTFAWSSPLANPLGQACSINGQKKVIHD